MSYSVLHAHLSGFKISLILLMLVWNVGLLTALPVGLVGLPLPMQLHFYLIGVSMVLLNMLGCYTVYDTSQIQSLTILKETHEDVTITLRGLTCRPRCSLPWVPNVVIKGRLLPLCNCSVNTSSS